MTNFYFDAQRNLLIYPRSDVIERYLPQAKSISGSPANGGQGLIAIPRTLQACQTLRWLNYPVPPVITDANYDWPAAPGVKPWESQKLAANFMALHPRCFNLSDMGVGKTYSTLWAADWLMKQHEQNKCTNCGGVGCAGPDNDYEGASCDVCDGTGAERFRALIVCPLSIMQRVWSDAIFKLFLGHRKIEILYGSQERRLEALARAADYYIVNFDGVGIGAHTRKRLELDGFSKALAERADIRLAIVDEASAYKDAQTKRHRLARLIIGQRDYLWMLTGTPTPNKPTDAYGLGKLLNNAFGKSFTTFQQETMIKVSNFVWRPQKDGYVKARQLLTPAIRFDIKAVWDGPEMTVQQREVPLTADQKKLMVDLKRDLQVIVKSGHPITATNEAAARQKFIQISLGAIYDSNHKWHGIDASPRIEELRAVIEEAPAKILVLVPLTSVVNLLYKELGPKRDKDGRQIHAGWSREIVNGDTSPKDRGRIFQAFQEETAPRILIADPGTLAHGLDLWAARTVVWFGAIDKTEVYLQANRRIHRPGQKFPTTIVQIVSNQLEREIFRRLETNESLQGLLLEMVRKGEL